MLRNVSYVFPPILLMAWAALWAYSLMVGMQSNLFLLFAVCIAAVILWMQSKFDYISPAWALVAPWIAVGFINSLNISSAFRLISFQTTFLILGVIIVALFAITISRGNPRVKLVQVCFKKARRVVVLASVIYLILTGVQIGLAGYIPLVRGITEGDTGYMDFGIKGLYGFYNAFATSLATFSIYLFILTRKRMYLVVAFLILLTFILFVTRQNIFTLLVQSTVLYSLMVRRIPLRRILFPIMLAGVMFSLIGDMRSGDIRELMQLKDDLQWLPLPIIWLYSYVYFTILNLDNTVMDPAVPFWDGRSFSTLIPSIFRSDFTKAGNFEILNFNVSSFLDLLVADGGFLYSMLFVAIVGWLTMLVYNRCKVGSSPFYLCTYSTLYFCGIFSFFINFWLYLPVIFQIPFFYLFGRIVAKRG